MASVEPRKKNLRMQTPKNKGGRAMEVTTYPLLLSHHLFEDERGPGKISTKAFPNRVAKKIKKDFFLFFMALRRPKSWPEPIHARMARVLGPEQNIMKKYESIMKQTNRAICRKLLLLGAPDRVKRVIQTNAVLRRRARARLQRLNAHTAYIVRNLQRLSATISGNSFTRVTGANVVRILSLMRGKINELKLHLASLKVQLVTSRNGTVPDTTILDLVAYVKHNVDFRETIFRRHAYTMNQFYEAIDAIRESPELAGQQERLIDELTSMSDADLFNALTKIMEVDIKRPVDQVFVSKLCAYAHFVHRDLHKLNVFHLVVANIEELYNSASKNRITLFDNISPVTWPTQITEPPGQSLSVTKKSTDQDDNTDELLVAEEAQEEEEDDDEAEEETLTHTVDTLHLVPETTFYELQQYLLWSPIVPQTNYSDT